MIRTLLGIGGLSLVWMFSAPLNAEPKELVLGEGRWADPIIGRGETVDAAKKNAMQLATLTVAKLMEKHQLQTYVVTDEYVANYLLEDAGVAGKDEEILEGAPPFKQWIVKLRSDGAWWKDLVRHDLDAQRQIRAKDRQTLTARLTFGLAALLLGGFGYLRLDEYTNRRYTTWLRLACVGILSTVAAGLWLYLGA